MTEANKEQMVTIPASEYAELLHSDALLNELYAGGVDNWMGWDDAIDRLNEGACD